MNRYRILNILRPLVFIVILLSGGFSLLGCGFVTSAPTPLPTKTHIPVDSRILGEWRCRLTDTHAGFVDQNKVRIQLIFNSDGSGLQTNKYSPYEEETNPQKIEFWFETRTTLMLKNIIPHQ